MALIDVIKYEGGNNVLVWKHPKEDFNTSAQLIVHDSQEAFIFRDGQMLGPYSAGKHTIETENIPGVRHLVGLVTGGVSPNHYEVFFVNKAYSMNISWGTATPWTIQDPSLNITFEMQAHGQFAVRVVDARELLLKLVGTTSVFTQRTVQDYFYGIMISRIKDHISNLIVSEGISHAEIGAHLIDISEKVSSKLSGSLVKYGLSLEEFVVENISILKDSIYTDVREAMKTRYTNTVLGVTEQEKMGYNVAKAQAQNPGVGGQMGQIFTGIATGAAVAPVIGSMMQNVVQPVASSQSDVQHRDQFSMDAIKKRDGVQDTKKEKCDKCGAELEVNAHFCNQCGFPIEQQEKTSITCPACGTTLSADSIFCKLCGTKL